MKESFSKIISQVKGYINGQMEERMKAHGEITKWMDLVSLFGQMEENIQEMYLIYESLV